MKTLINQIKKKIILPLAVITAFTFSSYSQKIEKTKDWFKEYNEKGQLITGCIQKGKNKSCKNYKYDAGGREIEMIFKEDYENDNKFDYLSQENYKYDVLGRKIEIIKKEKKEDNKTFDYLLQANYRYDELGREIEMIFKEDYENDSKFDYIKKTTIKYSQSGDSKLKISIDFNGDGIIDEVKEK